VVAQVLTAITSSTMRPHPGRRDDGSLIPRIMLSMVMFLPVFFSPCLLRLARSSATAWF
jgi:hypothetical protein